MDQIQEPRIGVFVCHCGLNIAGVVDVEAVAEYASKLPNVLVAKHSLYACSEAGQAEIIEQIRRHNLNRVVIASCTPRTHEPIFREACRRAGLNPYLLEFVNIREHCSWAHPHQPEEATRKAMDLVRMGVAKSKFLEPQQEMHVPVKKSAMVIGGGVTGLRAALDLADMGIQVYLVERSPSIGGFMALLDKTFPTMDCSICILGPIMNEAARHDNIKLLTYAEVEQVDGYVGNFRVKLRLNPKYVDWEKCTGCGECSRVCPVILPDEYNFGLATRKAIYIAFPQAVPRKALIDIHNCIKCRACIKVCQANAIHLEDSPRELEIEVGAIIVATGFQLFNPESQNLYGYGIYDNVITAMEFERMINASGPSMGKLVRISDLNPPKSVAFIQCVGSRDHRNNVYCSAFCCMYAIKNGLLIKEKYPHTKVYVLYMDIRTPYRGYEEFYQRARDQGIIFIRGRPLEIDQLPNGNLVIKLEDTLRSKLLNLEVELVILSIGAIPREESSRLKDLLKLPLAPDGFFAELHPKLKPVDTCLDGVFIAGAAAGPKEIPYCVSQASATAARAARYLIPGRACIEPLTSQLDPKRCISCGKCIPMCPYNAIQWGPEGKPQLIQILCKGCGTCAVACNPGAMDQRNFLLTQILAQIAQAME